MSETQGSRYRALTLHNVHRSEIWSRIGTELRESIRVVGSVFPFRTNTYVTGNLIDWSRVPEDPLFQLTFPQREMLEEEDYQLIRSLRRSQENRAELRDTVESIRVQLNPQPAGQLSHNVPELDGQPVDGIQHKYRETVLFFPAQGQTCHAYCSYCFRWPQFCSTGDMKFMARNSRDLVRYLERHREVSDLLVTGGDPMVMKTRVLRRYLEPVLSQLDHLQTVRIGTKALSYWPDRFVGDPDADDLLRFFEKIVGSGRHLALMAHFSHPVEMKTPLVREAISRLRSTGAEIRIQAPLIRHVNDDPAVWAEIWRHGVHLGLIPYYMFVARDTGPRDYFAVSLHRAHQIYRAATQQVSGLSRTVRGPSMSAFPGKVHLLGTAQVGREKVFVLQFLQARDPNWVGRPFFARFDPEAVWLDELEPAFGRSRFFFEREDEPWAVTTVA